MTNDDKFEEALTAMAREHNRPAAVPREEMWAVIAAARAATRRDAGEQAAAPAPMVIPMRPPRRVWRWAAIGGALAATLLLGIVIGRRSLVPAGSDTSAVAAANHPSGSAGVDTRGSGAAMPRTIEPAPTTQDVARNADTNDPSGPPNAPQRPVERQRAMMVAANGSSSREAPNRLSPRDAALPYRVAAMEHLVTTEALLVSLRSDVRAGRSDSTIANWAGDLLGTTRMLMDSPASKDPQLRQLLEDLELVLAQVSRLPGARGEAADLGLIDDAVQRRQIMTRLRALTPTT